ncbi:MAG: hypothetical protein PQJ60_10725 [Spirochaetales bacterium]|nr:hypothetical protein [Spirochaetales bacterium]
MAQMETDIMVRILSHLSTGAIGTATWEAEKLAQFGVISDSLVDLINSGTDEAVIAMKAELEKSSAEASALVDKNIPGSLAANLPDGADDQLKSVLSAWDQVASDQIKRAGATMLSSANKIYSDIVTKVSAEVLSGAVTGREAMANIATDWGQSGIPALKDSMGREWTTEAYTQMVIRTNSRQVSTATQENRLDQYDIDLVEISSHTGARPKCAEYQGRIFSREGKTKGYPLLSETSYGDKDGLFGINCQHRMYPYIPGTESTFKPVSEKDNQKAYTNSQKQRQLERNIRRAKRVYEAAAAVDPTSQQSRAAKDKVLAGQAAMRAFIDKTGNTRDYFREKLY